MLKFPLYLHFFLCTVVVSVVVLLLLGVKFYNRLRLWCVTRNRSVAQEAREENFEMPTLPPYDAARAHAHLVDMEKSRQREQNSSRARNERAGAGKTNPVVRPVTEPKGQEGNLEVPGLSPFDAARGPRRGRQSAGNPLDADIGRSRAATFNPFARPSVQEQIPIGSLINFQVDRNGGGNNAMPVPPPPPPPAL